MGTHAVSGKDAKNPGGLCLPAARAVAATGVLAISVCALNLSASTPESRTATASVVRPVPGMGAVGIPPGSSTGSSTGFSTGTSTGTGTGTVVHGSTDVGVPPSDGLVASPVTANILTAPDVEITFPRPLVSSSSESTPSPLAVELTGLGRPPAGYLMAPLKLLYPSSPFGFRVSPLSGAGGDFHLGQDYAAPCGTQVYAADSGVVRAAGWHPWGGGNRVEIDHGNGLISTYNHLESIAVRSGDSINVGQAIARVGSTGWSTGCHLHFETILNGHHVSPLKWGLIPVRSVGAGPADLRTYLPGFGAPSPGPVTWTIPVGQGNEPPPAPRWVSSPTTVAGSPSWTASPLSQLRPADSGTLSPNEPAASGTPSPTPSEPSGPGSPSPTPSEPSGPGTASPTPSEPADAGTPTPTPSEPADAGTPTPTPSEPADAGTPSPTPSEPADPGSPSPTPSEPAPAPIQPAPTPSEPAPAPIQPAPTPSEPSGPGSPSPTPSEPAPAPIQPAPTPSEPAPAPIQPAPTPSEPAPTTPPPPPPPPAAPAPPPAVPVPPPPPPPAPITQPPIEPSPAPSQAPAPAPPPPPPPAPAPPPPPAPAPIQPAPTEPAPIQPAPTEPAPPTSPSASPEP